jgi:predicted ferric reductase
MAKYRHSTIREGVAAGAMGGAAVALWFLLLDVVIQGRPFFTPNMLGQLVFQRGAGDIGALSPGLIGAYSALHFGMFALFGIVVTELVHLAVQYHIWRFALLVVLMVFEVFFVGFSFMLFTGTDGVFHWWAVLLGNTLALAAMGTYLFRTHPDLGHMLATETLGGE